MIKVFYPLSAAVSVCFLHFGIFIQCQGGEWKVLDGDVILTRVTGFMRENGGRATFCGVLWRIAAFYNDGNVSFSIPMASLKKRDLKPSKS